MVNTPLRLHPWRRWSLMWRRMSPPALFLWSFVFLISLGTLGLMMLPGLQVGPRLGFVDSLFTMTSAVTITGLTVADTATKFTAAGQAWILLFIQLGGIGLITLTSLIIGALGRRLSLRSEMLAVAPTRSHDQLNVWDLALGVTKFSLVVEAAGVLVLFLLWLPHYPADEAVWHATFHGISAYCNAGFSTFSTSMMGFADKPLTLIVISVLVIIGGLGFLTFEELLRWWRTSRMRRSGIRLVKRGPHRLSSHTWAVLVTSGVLLVLGWVLFAVFEWYGVLASMSPNDKVWNALFMSVSTRSSGFNSVDYTLVGNDTSALTMMLMFIGGSPGSMAGGIKTTTFAVLVALGLSRIRGHRFVAIKDRAIPQGTIERTVGIILLAMLIVVSSFFTLSAIEGVGLDAASSRAQFLPIAFETMSAFSTTGLSMNVTPNLQPSSKVIVLVMLFVGRVGLLSFFTAVVLRRAQPPGYLRPAQEDVIVG
ncbi:MAG: potassium transporter Trk [Deltaproteobacteria bacterium]|nr:potassium transporter Trk [Deltaproteobacteria bacterium]